MKKGSWILAALLSAGVLGFPAYVRAGSAGNGHTQMAAAARSEKDVEFNDIPQVVQDAVVAVSGGSKVRHVTHYLVHGKLHYHVVIGNGAVRQTLVLDDAGNLLITKELVDFQSLPDPVKQTMGRAAGPGKVLDSVEKVSDHAKTYYIGTTLQENGRNADKIIRVGEDGQIISGTSEDDIPLTYERVVPQSFRKLRHDIKTETKELDDLPGPAQVTIGAEAKGETIENVVHVLPAGNRPEVFVATVGKDAATQRRIFVDGDGNALDGAAELRPYIVRSFW